MKITFNIMNTKTTPRNNKIIRAQHPFNNNIHTKSQHNDTHAYPKGNVPSGSSLLQPQPCNLHCNVDLHDTTSNFFTSCSWPSNPTPSPPRPSLTTWDWYWDHWLSLRNHLYRDLALRYWKLLRQAKPNGFFFSSPMRRITSQTRDIYPHFALKQYQFKKHHPPPTLPQGHLLKVHLVHWGPTEWPALFFTSPPTSSQQPSPHIASCVLPRPLFQAWSGEQSSLKSWAPCIQTCNPNDIQTCLPPFFANHNFQSTLSKHTQCITRFLNISKAVHRSCLAWTTSEELNNVFFLQNITHNKTKQ